MATIASTAARARAAIAARARAAVEAMVAIGTPSPVGE